MFLGNDMQMRQLRDIPPPHPLVFSIHAGAGPLVFIGRLVSIVCSIPPPPTRLFGSVANSRLQFSAIVSQIQECWQILVWMRSSRVVGASDSQCRSRNCPGFDPRILRHSENWGVADEAVLNIVYKKKKSIKIPFIKNISVPQYQNAKNTTQQFNCFWINLPKSFILRRIPGIM
jgi:hypothetical protein